MNKEKSNWWLEPQTYGMFNYFSDTNYSRIKEANCSVNGYRLIYNLNDFDYELDIKKAHKLGIKYVAGIELNNDSFNKCKSLIKMGVDGLVIIQPFDINKSINLISRLRNISDIPIGIAIHGESFIPLTFRLLPFSNLSFVNLELEESLTHQGIYKIYSAFRVPVIASPVDASLGWLFKNYKEPWRIIQIKMAEAYANKGFFQDQYDGGLDTSTNTWLHKSINASAISKINSFYLFHKDLFNFSNLRSVAKVKVLLPLNKIKDKFSSEWINFNNITRCLSKKGVQYDVVFNNGTSSCKTKNIFVKIFPNDTEIQMWNSSNKIITHLINYGLPKYNFSLVLNLSKPKQIKMLSPDFKEIFLNFSYEKGLIYLNVPYLRVWDIIIYKY